MRDQIVNRFKVDMKRQHSLYFCNLMNLQIKQDNELEK